jgi:formyl-CoA transferase/CoA:oxalate CoA-transferase
MVAVGNDRLWRRFASVLDRPELADDPRFATNPDRVQHRAELLAIIETELGRRGTAEWAQRLEAAGIPCAPISSVGQALSSPQAQARSMVTELRHPTAGLVRLVSSPLKLGATPVRTPTAPPLLGQHTDAVLSEYGYSNADLDRMRASGVIR